MEKVKTYHFLATCQTTATGGNEEEARSELQQQIDASERLKKQIPSLVVKVYTTNGIEYHTPVPGYYTTYTFEFRFELKGSDQDIAQLLIEFRNFCKAYNMQNKQETTNTLEKV